ncbi:hypothetical protein BH11BAC7_BH11BAC7_14300 [soil metagenome]
MPTRLPATTVTIAVAIPEILGVVKKGSFPLDDYEIKVLGIGRNLFDDGYFPQCLLELWKAAIHNLRRRIEIYSVELFLSVVKDEAGRKNYNIKGDTLSQRWENVEDSVMIQGARKLGILKPKAAQVMTTINWMRNHASPSHESEDEVTMEDVLPLAAMLQANLFSQSLPEPGHSVASLFKPVKENALAKRELELFADHIRGFRTEDVRTCFGFLLDLLCDGVEPSLSNSQELLPIVWDKINVDLKRVAGFRYHNFDGDSTSDTSHDKGAKNRLLEFLIQVDGIAYIPDGARASIYRDLAKRLALAKDTGYGWNKEESVAETIAQFGAHVPSIRFEQFYQEVLAVYCGNYWGRSEAYPHLEPFILELNTPQLREILRLFRENERVKEELTNSKPKAFAIALLKKIKGNFTFAANKTEADETIKFVSELSDFD